MKIIETTLLQGTHKAAIYRLWNNEYPQQLQYGDIAELDSYLDNLADQKHYFVIDINGEIVGWAFTFERSSEKWFAIIVDGREQKKGIGRALLTTLKLKESRLNGWLTDHDRYIKADGTPYHSPLGFYLKNEFTVSSNIRLEIEKLSAVKITWQQA